MKEEIEAAGTYYRNQKDRQLYFSRSAQQRTILNEYFIIPNYVYTRTLPWLKVVGILLLIFGAFGTVVMALVSKNVVEISIGAVVAVLGIVALIVFGATKRVEIKPKKVMSAQEYEEAVAEKIASLDISQKCFDALGVSAEDMKRFPPITFTDNVLGDKSLFVYYRDKKVLHSSTQQVTYLFFAADRIFAYNIHFDMCCDTVKQYTSEIFYKDICDVTTENIDEVKILNEIKAECNTLEISIVSDFSAFVFGVANTDENMIALAQMRQLLASKRVA